MAAGMSQLDRIEAKLDWLHIYLVIAICNPARFTHIPPWPEKEDHHAGMADH